MNTHLTIEHTQLLLNSFQYWTNKKLLEYNSIEEAANLLYEAPFALVSHGTETDPIFNYANKTAQQLWELDFESFTKLPSRLSAEPILQSERDIFMSKVTQSGFVDDYKGIRVSKSGKRFYILNTTVWNLINDQGIYKGQAATFSNWEFIK